MLKVCEHLGISLEDSVGFGDSMNDLSMFEYAVHTVAMGKHAPGACPLHGICDKDRGRGRDAWR